MESVVASQHQLALFTSPRSLHCICVEPLELPIHYCKYDTSYCKINICVPLESVTLGLFWKLRLNIGLLVTFVLGLQKESLQLGAFGTSAFVVAFPIIGSIMPTSIS